MNSETGFKPENVALLCDIRWPVGPFLWGHCSVEHAEHAWIRLRAIYKPHCASCPSVHLSVCPMRAPSVSRGKGTAQLVSSAQLSQWYSGERAGTGLPTSETETPSSNFCYFFLSPSSFTRKWQICY